MNFAIESKPEFSIRGISRRFTTTNGENLAQIPKFWDEIMLSGEFGQLAKEAGEPSVFPAGTSMAACYDFDEPDTNFSYLIGFEAGDEQPNSTRTAITVPASTWAVFEARGALPDSIQSVWKSIHTLDLSSTPFELSRELPELEIYPGNEPGPDYICYVWIPLRSKQ